MSNTRPNTEQQPVPMGQLAEANFERWQRVSDELVEHLGFCWPLTAQETVRAARELEFDVTIELLELLKRRGLGDSPYEREGFTGLLLFCEVRGLWMPEKPGHATQHRDKKSVHRIRAELRDESYAAEVNHEMRAFDSLMLLGMLNATGLRDDQKALVEMLRQRIDSVSLEFVELTRRMP